MGGEIISTDRNHGETEIAAVVGRAGENATGARVGQLDGGIGHDRAGGIGDGAFERSLIADLGHGKRGEQQSQKQNCDQLPGLHTSPLGG
jgi:hypothetical protein